MYALLLIEVLNHRRVFAGQRLEALFPPRIRQAPAIENKSAAMSTLVFGHTPMKGKAQDPYDQVVALGRQTLQLLRSQHAVERFRQRRQRDGQRHIVEQPAQILECVGHTLQKMRFALVKTAKPVGSQSLQNAHINVRVEIMQKSFALDRDEVAESLDVKIKQLLAQLRGQIGLGIVQKGSNVILQRPFASALIIEKKRLTIAQHDVARLEIPVHEIVAIRAQQESRQTVEIVFQCLLIEGNSRQAQKVIFKIIEVPGDGLPVKASSRIANAVVQIASCFNLKARQYYDRVAIRCHRCRCNLFPGAIFRQKVK